MGGGGVVTPGPQSGGAAPPDPNAGKVWSPIYGWVTPEELASHYQPTPSAPAGGGGALTPGAGGSGGTAPSGGAGAGGEAANGPYLYDHGGVINEPVDGVGRWTGARYIFANNGRPETVKPNAPMPAPKQPTPVRSY